MSKFITENDIEQIALTILQEDLGYTVLYGPNIADGIERTHNEVVINGRLKAAIDKLNPTIPAEARDEAFKKVLRTISINLFENNEAFHRQITQGTGRNPDAIIKSREENTAFIVDAKAYTSGYSLGTDDRAIKEYINHYCPKLQKEGYKKIGFIIVSNSFKTSFDDFINDITWNTDIKRFILIESDALLHLLAYKTKDKFGLSSIIENLLSIGNLVKAQDVIEKFEDI
jgi:Restriction endonuclease FokI, C terminal